MELLTFWVLKFCGYLCIMTQRTIPVTLPSVNSDLVDDVMEDSEVVCSHSDRVAYVIEDPEVVCSLSDLVDDVMEDPEVVCSHSDRNAEEIFELCDNTETSNSASIDSVAKYPLENSTDYTKINEGYVGSSKVSSYVNTFETETSDGDVNKTHVAMEEALQSAPEPLLDFTENYMNDNVENAVGLPCNDRTDSYANFSSDKGSDSSDDSPEHSGVLHTDISSGSDEIVVKSFSDVDVSLVSIEVTSTIEMLPPSQENLVSFPSALEAGQSISDSTVSSSVAADNNYNIIDDDLFKKDDILENSINSECVDTIVADFSETVISADTNIQVNSLIQPAGWCQQCGTLALLDDHNSNNGFTGSLNLLHTFKNEHLPGCSFHESTDRVLISTTFQSNALSEECLDIFATDINNDNNNIDVGIDPISNHMQAQIEVPILEACSDTTLETFSDATQETCSNTTIETGSDTTIEICSDTTQEICSDASPEASSDVTFVTSSDATFVTSSDSTFGASSDATLEACSDATLEASSDATLEACSDATLEACSDATLEVSSDATLEASSDATLETSSDATLESSSDATPDTSSDATLEASSDATLEASSDASLEASSDDTPDTCLDATLETSSDVTLEASTEDTFEASSDMTLETSSDTLETSDLTLKASSDTTPEISLVTTLETCSDSIIDACFDNTTEGEHADDLTLTPAAEAIQPCILSETPLSDRVTINAIDHQSQKSSDFQEIIAVSPNTYNPLGSIELLVKPAYTLLELNEEISKSSKNENNRVPISEKSCGNFESSLRCKSSEVIARTREAIDMSCGFSTLSSVSSSLFEKCKARRDPPAQTVTLQPEQCSIVDTPLYVPDSCHEEPLDIMADPLPNKNHQILNYVQMSSTTAIAFTTREMHVSERRLGVYESRSNPCILEESEDNSSDLHNPLESQNSSQFSKNMRDDVCSTSAPCSPVPPIGSLNVAERKRKINSCAHRRVSFPEDETRLITSYLEPVDPWQQMKSSVTSDAVMAAYLDSCSSHNCSPIPAVLNQIAALPLDIPGRVECFSLKGCKLELNQCEGLEEIFKRVQFINIDLEGCSLTDDTIIPLVDMIEFYDSATQLNISCNTNIATRGWQACARMLKKTQSVQYLDARSTNLNEVNMPILGKALRLGARLHTLHLENCNLTGRPLVTLAAALKMNDTLIKLYLSDNKLGSIDCIQLGNLLRTNTTLKLLDLRNNNMQDSGCALVCEGVGNQRRLSLSPSLPGTNKSNTTDKSGLNSLVLWNNHMTVSSAKHLASMMSNSQSLETLNVGRNSITNDGVICLKESLLRNNSLRRLYLHATKITDEGAVALAEFIAESKYIERVDLRDNSIKVAGLLALAHSLRHNSSVVQMDLDSKPRSETIEELAEKHVSLLIEIKDYAHRNRTQLHVMHNIQSSKDSDSEDYSLDPDFRKLSLSSEISPENSQPVSLEESHAVTPPPKTSNEDVKKYRSPSPSPCASPILSPAPSPTPSPLRNRFKVFKVTPHDPPSPTGSLTGTSATPILGVSNNVTLSSSAPTSSLPVTLSTTSRPVFYQPNPPTRNRFLSGGGRFTVTKVSDSASKNLPCRSLVTTSMDSIIPSEPSSPKIVISSPAKVERGFSLDESNTNIDNSLVTPLVAVTESSTAASEHGTLSLSISTSASENTLIQMKSDSTESDDVFVDPIQSGEDHTKKNSKPRLGFLVSPSSVTRKELTDSGFLEEQNTEFEDTISNLVRQKTNAPQDSDRDSLFSNTSDPDGHSPQFPTPPTAIRFSSPTLDNVIGDDQPITEELTGNEGNPLFPGFKMQMLESDTSITAPNQFLSESMKSTASQPEFCDATINKAPLASIENGSFESDSEDSELTTQSSDSTHSDEVRITAEVLEPQQAWCSSSSSVLDDKNLQNSKNQQNQMEVDHPNNDALEVITSDPVAAAEVE